MRSPVRGRSTCVMLALLALALTALAQPAPAQEPTPPNTIAGVTDDQRFDQLGVARHPALQRRARRAAFPL